MNDEQKAALARQALDLYKDRAMRTAMVGVDHTQMRTLASALERAVSLEEIEIVLRYQAARLREKWNPKLVERLLQLFRKAGESVDGRAPDADKRRAEAASRQLGLIVRLHKVAHAEAGGQREQGR